MTRGVVARRLNAIWGLNDLGQRTLVFCTETSKRALPAGLPCSGTGPTARKEAQRLTRGAGSFLGLELDMQPGLPNRLPLANIIGYFRPKLDEIRQVQDKVSDKAHQASGGSSQISPLWDRP
jgi:hypothetical protein